MCVCPKSNWSNLIEKLCCSEFQKQLCDSWVADLLLLLRRRRGFFYAARDGSAKMFSRAIGQPSRAVINRPITGANQSEAVKSAKPAIEQQKLMFSGKSMAGQNFYRAAVAVRANPRFTWNVS